MAEDMWSSSTLNRRMVAIRYWCKWANHDDPLKGYKPPPRLPPKPHPLSGGLADVFAMLGHARNNGEKVVIALGGLCGLRIGETIELKWEDWDNTALTLEVFGKGEKTRIIPISEYTNQLLWAWEGHLGGLGSINRIIPWSDSKARRAIRAAGKAAGFHVASHDLRATFATQVYNDTKDIRLVQQLLGHTNIHTTEAYVGVTMGSMRAAVGALGGTP